jgi:Protein of unknown function (DUF3224)
MNKLISTLAALLLLALSISVAPAEDRASERTYSSGIRKPAFGIVVDARVIPEGCIEEPAEAATCYQIIHTIWPVEWTGAMEGESSYDHIIIESPDKLLLSFEGIDTFKGTIGDSKPGSVRFKVTGRTTRVEVGDEGAVEGRFELIPGSGKRGLKHLSSAHGVFQRQHDQPVGAYAIIFQFDDDDGDDDKKKKRRDHDKKRDHDDDRESKDR